MKRKIVAVLMVVGSMYGAAAYGAEQVLPNELPNATQLSAAQQPVSFSEELYGLLSEKEAFMDQPDREHVTFDFFNKAELAKLEESTKHSVKNVEFNKQTKRFKVKVLLEQQPPVELLIQGRYEEYMTIPVINVRLKAGNIIRQSDISRKKIPVTQLRHNTVRDETMLLGKTSKHALMANKALSSDDIVMPSVIKKNDLVNLVYQKGALTLQEKGAVAMQSGALGETIKVKKENNNIILGIVESGDVVRVTAR